MVDHHCPPGGIDDLDVLDAARRDPETLVQGSNAGHARRGQHGLGSSGRWEELLKTKDDDWLHLLAATPDVLAAAWWKVL